MANEPKKFYILDTRTGVGNCAVFWCPNGAGYTTQLEEAGLFSEEEARSHRETDIPIPEEMAKACSVTHVRLERLREALDQTGVAWPRKN
jgi:hypothetical protein